LGVPFFDFIADIMGFEKAILYFCDKEENHLLEIRDRYIAYQQKLAGAVIANTCYESFVIGCSYSCNSLIGPEMWRKWDRPYITAMAEMLHQSGKLLHIHFHGKSTKTVSDFPQMGVDCVCPFERPPGGDVDGVEGLAAVREMLADKTTFNGNVHTVDTLIRGEPKQVRREVAEIKQAFEGSCRYIIGSGDQVGYETPEDNILAMIEEGKS
jgi:uroporphyrinogen-III decarboxylase